MSRKTIQERINHAQQRTDKEGQPRPESTLNLTFSAERIRLLVREFNLDETRDGLPTIVAKIGERLGVHTTAGDYYLPIVKRLTGQSSVGLSFLIDAVYELCRMFHIDPATQSEDELADAIFSAVIPGRIAT